MQLPARLANVKFLLLPEISFHCFWSHEVNRSPLTHPYRYSLTPQYHRFLRLHLNPETFVWPEDNLRREPEHLEVCCCLPLLRSSSSFPDCWCAFYFPYFPNLLCEEYCQSRFDHCFCVYDLYERFLPSDHMSL